MTEEKWWNSLLKEQEISEAEIVSEEQEISEPELVSEEQEISEPELVSEEQEISEPELVSEEQEISEPELVSENDDHDWHNFDRPSEENGAQDRGELLNWEYHKERKVPSNQCAVDTRTPGKIFSNTFYHRVVSETFFTKALKGSDILFAPMTAWMRGRSGSKVEPDFLVLAYQQLGIMEINGNSHKEELADKRQKRIQCFRDQCVFVQDYSLPDEYDLNFAYSCVEDFLRRLKDRKIYMAGRIGGIDNVE